MCKACWESEYFRMFKSCLSWSCRVWYVYFCAELHQVLVLLEPRSDSFRPLQRPTLISFDWRSKLVGRKYWLLVWWSVGPVKCSLTRLNMLVSMQGIGCFQPRENPVCSQRQDFFDQGPQWSKLSHLVERDFDGPGRTAPGAPPLGFATEKCKVPQAKDLCCLIFEFVRMPSTVCPCLEIVDLEGSSWLSISIYIMKKEDKNIGTRRSKNRTIWNRTRKIRNALQTTKQNKTTIWRKKYFLMTNGYKRCFFCLNLGCFWEPKTSKKRSALGALVCGTLSFVA